MLPHRLFLEKPQVNRRIEYLDPTGPERGATVLFGEVLGVSPTLGWGVGRVICILLVVSQLL